MDPEFAPQVFDTLEALVAEGKVAAYGWSTDFMPQALSAVDYPHFVAFENDYNVFTPAEGTDAARRGEGQDLALAPAAGHGPADRQVQAGRQARQRRRAGAGASMAQFFKDGKPNAAYLERIAALRDLLQSGGRSLAQGALGWILAKSPVALPVPGFKTEAQVADNLGANRKGPLPASVMDANRRSAGRIR